MTHETTVSNLLIVAIICFAAGATGSLLTASKPTVARFTAHILAIAGSVAVLGLGVIGVGGGTLNKGVQLFTPLGGLRFGLDRLSAFFLLIIAIGAIPASLYGIGYTREYDGKRSLAALGFAFNLFLAAMTLVALASNVLTFLLFWELMSLASYLLVMTESDREGTEHAGWIYLVMTHGGFACLLLGFLLCSNATGTMNFTGWTAQVTHLSGATRNACFVLLAAGFGSKAGLVPLHAWLPRAHPAAPSHVSALMSGVMIKLGIYGLIRIGFDWLGTGPAWWGGSLLVAAAISAMVGVLYALVESDLKRLLAYSSVENIGIITLGIGSGLLFHTYHREPLAALALVAALFHTLNHALFKGLLFSGAGSILQAVHTRNLEKMGGLIKRMPHTAVLFLIGTVAIAALPPLNGFFSEWLTFQSLLLSFEIPVRAVSLVFALSVGALALTSGLAAACFVKAFGIGFLALPRSEQAARATEAPVTMRAAMALLAVACIALGIAPVLALRIITPTAAELIGSSPDLHYNWHTVVANNAFASVSPLWLGVGLVSSLAAVPIVLRLLGLHRHRRYYETWGCGRALQTARFEYTAAAFSNPFKRVFRLLYRPVKELDIEFHPESRFFVRTIAYRDEARSIIEEALFIPIVRMSHRLARWSQIVQSGNVHLYLLYILVGLVILLVFAR